MKPSRLVAATAIGVSYPSIVAAIAAGMLTFTAARVFAESAPQITCSDPRVVECAAENAQCTSCGTSECKCESRLCFDGGGSVDALLCSPVYNACTSPTFAVCADGTEGAPCGDGGSGTCQPASCDALLDGSFERKSALVCVTKTPAADASSPTPDAPTGGKDAGSSSDPPASAPTASSSGGGCSAASGAQGGPLFASAAATLGILLLWRSRRRRS